MDSTTPGHRLAVLGGGATGVTAAGWLARRFGAQVDLFEASPTLGGLHKSVALCGRDYDVGAFVFDPAHDLFQVFPELAEDFIAIEAQFRRVTPSGALDIYPISIGGYIRDVGLSRATVSFVDFMLAKLRYRQRASVAEYASYCMGRRIYEDSGLKNYIERLYSRPDHEVDLDFALQRLRYIEQLTLSRALRSVLQRMMRGHGGDQAVKVMIRPPGGFGACYGKVQTLLEAAGVQIFASTRLQSVRSLGEGRFEVQSDQFTRCYDGLISTIPVADALRLLGCKPQGNYETVTLVTLFYRSKVLFAGDFIYNFTFEGRWKRITVFSRMYREADVVDRYAVEIPIRQGEPITVEALQSAFEAHALQLGLVSGRPERVGSYTTERAYPVFLDGKTSGVAHDRAMAQSLGIRLAGRQGTFAYLSSAESAAQGKQVVHRWASERP